MNVKTRILALLLATALLATQMGVAFAQDGTPPPPNDVGSWTVIEVPMVLDCGSLTGSAKAYAKRNNLCPTSGGGGGVVPQDTRTGDCGSTSLYIFNLGGGYARFNMAATSTNGAMAYVDYSTNWQNWNNGLNGNISGRDWVWSSTWSRNEDRYTGAGFVTATMSGSATLWWGGLCVFLNPSDAQNISNP